MPATEARIAITGSTGIGKTTLARALAQALDVPLLDEDMRAVADARRAYLEMGRSPGTPKPQVRAALLEYLDACDEWLRARNARQAELGGFIADRWAIDLLSSLLMGGLGPAHNELILRWVRECRAQARQFDLIVMPPMMRMSDERTNEQGLPRSGALSQRLLNHCLLRGLIEQLSPTPRLYLPASARTVAERVASVTSALGNLRGVPGGAGRAGGPDATRGLDGPGESGAPGDAAGES